MAAILRSVAKRRGIQLPRLLMDPASHAASQQIAPQTPSFTHCASTNNSTEHLVIQFSRSHPSQLTSGLLSQIHLRMFRNISTMRGPSLSPPPSSGKDQPVPSPLTMVPMPAGSSIEAPSKEQVKRPVQAVLKKIKESPKKVNLVASLVRGMRVEDALMQLAVLQKRAAKTVKRVVANARANATHNHGLNGDRLYVAEAFVGKGKYLRRISIHAKGRSGIMHHPSCRLTVIVKELSEEQENEIARYKSMTFRERAKVKSKLFPHKLIEVSPQWNRKAKGSSHSIEA